MEQFSYNGRVLRTSLIVDIPLLMVLIHHFVLWCFGFLLKCDDRRLNKLEKTFNEMLADLKVSLFSHSLITLITFSLGPKSLQSTCGIVAEV